MSEMLETLTSQCFQLWRWKITKPFALCRVQHFVDIHFPETAMGPKLNFA